MNWAAPSRGEGDDGRAPGQVNELVADIRVSGSTLDRLDRRRSLHIIAADQDDFVLGPDSDLLGDRPADCTRRTGNQCDERTSGRLISSTMLTIADAA